MGRRGHEQPFSSEVKDELAKLLASNQVILVHGETGSGKTTQIGQFVVDGTAGPPARVVPASFGVIRCI